MEEFKAKQLPYTMGNSGDLIKHGMLCELINWLSNESNQRINFYDPFGGRPWQSPINQEVARRLANLHACPLKIAQNDAEKRYFGSGHIVSNLSKINQYDIKIYTSDRDEKARDDLTNTGLNLITLDEFNPDSAYSILNCKSINEENAIILIDPFYDLQHINDTVLKKVIELVSKKSIAVILYVLYVDDETDYWEKFKDRNKQLIQNNVYYHSLSCKAILDSSVEGEGKFHSSVSLYLNHSLASYNLSELTYSLKKFSENLKEVINQDIKNIHL